MRQRLIEIAERQKRSIHPVVHLTTAEYNELIAPSEYEDAWMMLTELYRVIVRTRVNSPHQYSMSNRKAGRVLSYKTVPKGKKKK